MNKSLFLKCLVAAVGVLGLAYIMSPNSTKIEASSSPVPAGSIGNAYHWTLKFQDEFSTSSIDTSKWTSCINWGYTSDGCYENLNQKEWYLTANRTQSNGILTLIAKKETVNTSKGTFDYTSGFINSDRTSDTTAVPPKFDFQYGYVEMRAKVPAGKGLWPAFWMLPSDHSTSSEIDIMEILGDHPEKNYMTYHYGSHQEVDGSYTIQHTDFSKGYHTYAVDWSADAIVWYIDGTEVFRLTNKAILPAKKFYLIANLQVGGDWPGDPNSSTVFPADYNIDYIRVWSKGAAVTPAPTATPKPTTTTPVPTVTHTATPSITTSVTPTGTSTPVVSDTPTDTVLPTETATQTPTPTLTQRQAWVIQNWGYILLTLLLIIGAQLAGFMFFFWLRKRKESQEILPPIEPVSTISDVTPL